MIKKTLIILIIVSSILAFIVLTEEESHRYYKYLIWKHKLVDIQIDNIGKYLNMDSEYRNSMIGKTEKAFKERFPVLINARDADSILVDIYDENKVDERLLENDKFYWLPKSAYHVIFRDRIVIEFKTIKGPWM